MRHWNLGVDPLRNRVRGLWLDALDTSEAGQARTSRGQSVPVVRTGTARFRLWLVSNLLSSQFWEGIFLQEGAGFGEDAASYLSPVVSQLVYLSSAD